MSDAEKTEDPGCVLRGLREALLALYRHESLHHYGTWVTSEVSVLLQAVDLAMVTMRAHKQGNGTDVGPLPQDLLGAWELALSLWARGQRPRGLDAITVPMGYETILNTYGELLSGVLVPTDRLFRAAWAKLRLRRLELETERAAR